MIFQSLDTQDCCESQIRNRLMQICGSEMDIRTGVQNSAYNNLFG
ncbi:hypothetical protein FDUTEX481_04201 [Tolypothrix sp. PCC 7601]|nr:hypothetical protein FDUTEX481_04201 [Tolypothrix sp. PCC 7601]